MSKRSAHIDGSVRPKPPVSGGQRITLREQTMTAFGRLLSGFPKRRPQRLVGPDGPDSPANQISIDSAQDHPEVPDTNPQETKEFWDSIKRSQRDRGKGEYGKDDDSFHTPEDDPPDYQTNPPSCTDDHDVFKTPSIIINFLSSHRPSATSHFKTQPPPERLTALWYRRRQGLDQIATCWLPLSPLFVGSVVAKCKAIVDSTPAPFVFEEFTTFAMKTFFQTAHEIEAPLKQRGPKYCKWRPALMVDFACLPSRNNRWVIPPLLDEGTWTNFSAFDGAADERWSWDIRTACAYCLSFKEFGEAYADGLKRCTFVDLEKSVTLSYLTIEFRRGDEENGVAARRRAWVAGVLVLYNRYRLHSGDGPDGYRYFDIGPGSSSGSGTEHIRHYAITFSGTVYKIWVFKPILDQNGKWIGCEVTEESNGDCIDVSGTRRLINWINEVQRWGLSQYAPAFARDVRFILKSAGWPVTS